MPEIRCISIDFPDGSQTRLDPGDEVWGLDGKRVALGEIPHLLADPGCVLVLSTASRFVPDREWEATEEWRRADKFIYARGVVSVLVEYKELADG